MAIFEWGAVALGGAGLVWMARALWPAFEPEPDLPQDDSDGGDLAERLEQLTERQLRDDDDGTAWNASIPMDLRRDWVHGALRPASNIVWSTDPPTWIPFHTCLFTLPDAPDRVRGRRQGRTIDAVRLQGDRFLDLYEATRLLPVLALETEARGRSTAWVTGAAGDIEQADSTAAWLVTGQGPRVLPDELGTRTFEVTLDGEALHIEADMNAVAHGLQTDDLAFASVVTFRGHPHRGPADPISWTLNELLDVASMARQLEAQEVDLSDVFLEVFADRSVPIGYDERSHMVAAGLLNWVGAAHRRAGRPRAARQALMAGRTAAEEGDDDNLGDLWFNLGLCAVDLRGHEPDGLDRAKVAFENAARHHPEDPAAYEQLALVHHLQGRYQHEYEAWLQAATRAARDLDRYAVLMANATAASRR